MAIPFQACVVIAGCVLVHLTLGTLYTFGNLSPYITSYIRKHSSPSDLDYAVSVWINAMGATCQGVSMYFGGKLEFRLGPRLTVLLGAWFQSLGVALTYFAIQHSFALTVVTYGVMFGLGIGVAYAVPMAVAMRWLPDRKGLVNGFVVAGFGGGAFIFDQIQTAYINPHNQPAVLTDKGEKYFTQEDILDRVPKVFLLLGGCYAAMQFLGCLPLRNPPGYQPPRPVLPAQSNQEEEERRPLLSQERRAEIEEHGHHSDNIQGNGASKDRHRGEFERSQGDVRIEQFPNGPKAEDSGDVLNGRDVEHHAGPASEQDRGRERAPGDREFDSIPRDLDPELGDRAVDELARGVDPDAGNVLDRQSDVTAKPAEYAFTPGQILGIKDFYKLWFIFLSNGQGVNFVGALYKAYGQTFISNDTFLAWVGTFSAVCNASGRIFWGSLADRFSFKVAMMCLCASFTVLMLTLGVTSLAGRAMFIVWVGLLFFSFSGSFSLMPTACARSFGQAHVSSNYGLLFSSQVVTSILSAVLTSQLKNAIGWYGMFFMVAGFSFLSFLIASTFNRKTADGRHV